MRDISLGLTIVFFALFGAIFFPMCYDVLVEYLHKINKK